jgi:hypothetical protein
MKTEAETVVGMEWFSHSFEFPRTEAPQWSAAVERWYQLDAAAFALTETYWRHRERLSTRPEVMFLASPLASNVTDAQFAATVAPSPAKFVHTLPNIRGASLLAVMGWAGEVYCVQKDPETALTAISEGMHAIKSSGKEVWILSVTDASGIFTGHVLRLTPDVKGCPLKIVENETENMAFAAAHDKDLFLWLKDGSGRFSGPGFALLR